MSVSAIHSLGMQGLTSAAESEMKIARMLQATASQMQAQTDRVTISPEAMKLLEANRG
jgi:hypothetical protein